MTDSERPVEPSDLDDRLRDAAALADEGRWGEAFEILLAEEAAHPNDAVLLGVLGAAAREIGAEGQAYEYFRRCLAQQPSDPVLLATAGAGLAALDDPEAESVLRLAALSAPDLPLARMQYGAYLAREGLFGPAAAELEAARSLDPENPAVRTELATAYLLAGRIEEGVAEWEEALSHAPDDAWIRALFGLALLEAGRAEEAAEELHRAATDRTDDAELQLVAALAAAAQEWMDEAWAGLARAEAADGDVLLIGAAEEAIEAGAEAAAELLHGDVAPSVLRKRLLERP